MPPGQSTIVPPRARPRRRSGNIIFNNFSIGTAANELKQVNNTYQGSEDFTKVIGAHTIRAGSKLPPRRDQRRPHRAVQRQLPVRRHRGPAPTSPTSSSAHPTAYNQSQLNPFYGRNNYVGAYVQDSWHAAPSLVPQLRPPLDHIAPWREKYNQISTFVPGEQSIVFPNAPAGILYPGDPGVHLQASPLPATSSHLDLASASLPRAQM